MVRGAAQFPHCEAFDNMVYQIHTIVPERGKGVMGWHIDKCMRAAKYL